MRQEKRKGIVLIVAYSVIVSLLVIAGAILHRAVTEMNLARRNMLETEAMYLAEGGIEKITYKLTYNIANNIAPPTNISANGFLGSDFNLFCTCTDEDGADTTVTDALGIATFVRHYKMSGYATHSQYGGITRAVHQVIARKKTYTFQHAVFYEDDLEMIPGQDMTLSGKVHSNHDIYIAADGSGTDFTIDSEYLYSAEHIYNKRKDDGSRLAGTVDIKKKGTATYVDMEDGGVYYDSDYANWTTESQTRWGGTVKSVVHGVTALAAPEVGSIGPTGYYAGQAQSGGLKITKKSGGTWEIYSGGTQINLSDLPADTLTENSFEDKREGTTVTVVDIDMAKLNASGYFPANGLLYATREDATVSQPNGVRLTNGSTLNNGLTVVSNNSVYIKGDYNNSSKKPAAVICDAVNLLSNSWDDSHNDFSDRDASDTTVNTAFISGIVPTPDGGGTYSGGLENYPRLLENWTGRTLTIYGSFVELWQSQIAKGDWQYGSPKYTAPNRDWHYDTDFNNSANLPPFTPFAVEAERVVWWLG